MQPTTKTDAILRAGNTAVVTGAALGIGRAMAGRLAAIGLNVCLADLPGDDLDAAVVQVRESSRHDNGSVIGLATDVSDQAQVAALAAAVLERFGAPHLLMNNAVTRVGKGMDADLSAWRRAMEVNFFGVVIGVRAFLPSMQAAGGPRMIVNTGSKQGITNPPGHPIYNATKAALKAYTESLEHELRTTSRAPQRVSAHLLVPGWTTTGKNAHRTGAWMPAQVVEYLLAHLATGDFYIICPDDETTTEMDNARITWAAGDITANRPALSRWHPDYRDAFKT